MSDTEKVYDATEVSLNAFGIPIDSGFPDGDFVKLTQVSDRTSEVEGTDGEIAISKKKSRLYDVSIIVMQTSDAQAALSAVSEIARKTPGSVGAGPFTLKDRQGITIYSGKIWFKKDPDRAFGKEAGQREWKFRAALDEIVDGGN